MGPAGDDKEQRFGAAAAHLLSVLDRVDALRALYVVVATPRQRAMLKAAHQVLGHVVRDPAWLHALELTRGLSS